MTTNFPSSADAFTNPTSGDTLDNPPHDQQHADINDAMEAVQTSLLDGAPLKIDDANERVGIGTASPDDKLHVVGDVTIEVTDDGSAAQPEVTLHRGSASPADGDYLGQVKFAGKNDAGQTVNYAKITGKISDVTDTTEDGLIEIANISGGSQSIGYRFTSTDLKLLNGRGLQVDGNVGIGTTTPTYALDVEDSTAAIVSLNDSGGTVGAGTNSRVIFEAGGSTAGEVGFLNTGSGVLSLKNNDGAIYLTTSSADGILFRPNATEAMRIDSSGNVGIGTTSPSQLLDIDAGTSGSVELTTTGGRTIQLTANDSEPFLSVGSTSAHSAAIMTNGVRRLTVDSSGNVGIGITSPNTDLHVRSEANTLAFLESTDGEALIAFSDNSSTGNWYDRRMGVVGNDMVFITSNSTRMTIDSSGNVGINDTSPSYTMDVNGTLRATGEIRADGNISLRSANGAHDSIYRVGGIYFTWDSDSYGTNDFHSIRSTDGDTWSDDITINSYGNVRINIDTNNNGNNVFTIGRNTTHIGNYLMTLDEAGHTDFVGTVGTNTGMTVGGLRAASSINATYADNSSIQFATDTYWGGTNTAHTGFLMWCGGMSGWNTAQLGFRVGSNWGTYHSSNPLRLSGTRTYINLGGESTYNVYADGGGRIGYYSSRRDLKNHVSDIAPVDALARIMQLQPIDFTWKKEHRPEGDLANELIDFNVHRGFYAEDAAAVDVTYGTYGWVASEEDAEDGEVSHLEPITEPLEHYNKSLEDAVVVSYDDKAILADLVGSVQALESRIAQLETTL